ncbi:MAG: hypothetical protein K0R18_1654 [Bacillales bacterium]|jgi:ribosome maturation factor RimP|nr:hypothetical protein [Bacillales bacterium]
MKRKVVDIVEELIKQPLIDMNVELVDIEYVKEGKDWFLRIYVDTENGIDIDTCSDVSEKVSELLDAVDPIEHLYFLEVSSPGAERPIKKKEDFPKYIGKNIFVKLYEPLDGIKTFEGELISFDDNILVIEVKIKTRKKQFSVPYEKIASARLAISFA